MDILTALKISGSGLKAERERLNVTAMNLANANTTRTMEGGPYKAKSVVFGSRPVASFRETLDSTQARLQKVEVVKVVEVVAVVEVEEVVEVVEMAEVVEVVEVKITGTRNKLAGNRKQLTGNR